MNINTNNKTNLDEIPLTVLIEKVESRKNLEVTKIVAQINDLIRKLNDLYLTPYNKTVLEQDSDVWNITSLNIEKTDDRITGVYYQEVIQD